MIPNPSGSVTEKINKLVPDAEYHVEEIRGEKYSVQKTLRPNDIEFDPPQRITSSMDLDDITAGKHLNLKSMFFSRIDRGDLRNSTITFLTACVGAGILSFPQIFSFFGIALSLVITVLFAYLNYETYSIIDVAINRSGRRGYGNICAYFFGPRIAKFCMWGMASVLFVISCVYASITWNFLERILDDTGVVKFPLANPNTGEFLEYSSKTFFVRFVSLAIIGVLCFPLLLLRKLTALRFVTAGIMLVIAYIFLLTVIQTPSYISHFKDKDSYEVDFWPPALSYNMISGIGALSMSFSSQPIYIFIRSEMVHKSERRTKQVYKVGLIVEFLIYATFGLCGYLSMGKNNVPTIYTQRHSIGNSDIWMLMARWAFLPLIALHVLLPFITLREMILQSIHKKSQTAVVLLSVVLTVAIFMLPVVYPNVLALMGIFGGLFSGFFCCVSLFVIGTQMTNSLLRKFTLGFFAFIFTWSAFANTYTSLVGVFSSN